MGDDPLVPAISLKMTSACQLGASADAKLKRVNRANVESMIGFRPYISLSGPKRSGPRT